jgi:hypothetical protein
MFAVLGMYLYPFIKHSDSGITSNANFTSFLRSFFSLLKISTGEEWNLMQADASRLILPSNVCFEIWSFSDYQ